MPEHSSSCRMYRNDRSLTLSKSGPTKRGLSGSSAVAALHSLAAPPMSPPWKSFAPASTFFTTARQRRWASRQDALSGSSRRTWFKTPQSHTCLNTRNGCVVCGFVLSVFDSPNLWLTDYQALFNSISYHTGLPTQHLHIRMSTFRKPGDVENFRKFLTQVVYFQRFRIPVVK